MEQKITFEDGKLVILTDNGKICGDETTTKIEGEFAVQAEDVEMIRDLIANRHFSAVRYKRKLCYADDLEDVCLPICVETSDENVAKEFRVLLAERDCAKEQANRLRRFLDTVRSVDEWKLSRMNGWIIWTLFVCAIGVLISGVAESLISYRWYEGVPECIYGCAIYLFTRSLWVDRKSARLTRRTLYKSMTE